MESTLGLIGTIIGALGLVLAIFVAIMQAKEQKRNAQERAEEKELHAKERAEEKELHAKELEMQKEETARNNRLMFLADRIFDSSIPRELRQPFYEEYISMKGNGTAVRFWLLEGEREKKTQHG
jgi:hypothetical protein